MYAKKTQDILVLLKSGYLKEKQKLSAVAPKSIDDANTNLIDALVSEAFTDEIILAALNPLFSLHLLKTQGETQKRVLGIYSKKSTEQWYSTNNEYGESAFRQLVSLFYKTQSIKKSYKNDDPESAQRISFDMLTKTNAANVPTEAWFFVPLHTNKQITGESALFILTQFFYDLPCYNEAHIINYIVKTLTHAIEGNSTKALNLICSSKEHRCRSPIHAITRGLMLIKPGVPEVLNLARFAVEKASSEMLAKTHDDGTSPIHCIIEALKKDPESAALIQIANIALQKIQDSNLINTLPKSNVDFLMAHSRNNLLTPKNLEENTSRSDDPSPLQEWSNSFGDDQSLFSPPATAKKPLQDAQSESSEVSSATKQAIRLF